MKVVLQGLLCLLAWVPLMAGAQTYAGEDRDWGVAPTKELRRTEYHAPTPREIPGGKVITTGELKALLEQPGRPYLIDVLGGTPHTTLAGAFWLVGAGPGDLNPEEQKRFVSAMAKFAGGDRNRGIVFFCSGPQCWLSYNAALRAIAAGYTNVMWYRGGIEAWRAASLPTSLSDPFAW